MNKTEQSESHLCTISNEELVVKAEEWIQRLINTGGREWSLPAPANPNRDVDLILSEVVHRFKKQQPTPAKPKSKTMKEILDNWNGMSGGKLGLNVSGYVFGAMREYATLHTQELADENERLRKALEKIAQLDEGDYGGMLSKNIANRALTPTISKEKSKNGKY